MLQYLLQLSKNVVSTGINKKTLILVKCPLYNFVPRGVSIFENAKATVGNQIVSFIFKKKNTGMQYCLVKEK